MSNSPITPQDALTSGKTYWVVSVMPRSPRVSFRRFFVLVDAQTGKVSDRRYVATFPHRVPIHVAGERPLVTPPNVSIDDLAASGYLFEKPASTARVTRAQALRVAGKTPGIPGGVASPAHSRAQTVLLARVWSSSTTLVQTQPLQWVIARPAHQWSRVTHGRLSMYGLVFIDAMRGTMSEAMCCVLEGSGFSGAP